MRNTQAEQEQIMRETAGTLRRQRDDLLVACLAAARMADDLRIAVSNSESDSDDATAAISAQISRILREAALAVQSAGATPQEFGRASMPQGIQVGAASIVKILEEIPIEREPNPDPYAPTPAAVEQARIDFERCHAAWMNTTTGTAAGEEARRHKDEALIRWRSMRAAAGLDAPQ
jgi:hypothetical protein